MTPRVARLRFAAAVAGAREIRPFVQAQTGAPSAAARAVDEAKRAIEHERERRDERRHEHEHEVAALNVTTVGDVTHELPQPPSADELQAWRETTGTTSAPTAEQLRAFRATRERVREPAA